MKKAFFLLAFFALVISASNSFAQKKKKDFVITIGTEYGEMVVMLYDATPKHKENFLKLAKDGYYNGTTFHRIIKNFMIQGGDPNSKDGDPFNDGNGGPGYTIPAEFVDTLTHVQGALAAARMGDGVNPKKESSGSQFYIVENPTGTPFLNMNYTVFGKVIKGIDVVQKIADLPRDRADRPTNDVKMTIKVKKMRVKKIVKKYGTSI
jgi:cyclophilin family peptidyl-prolyl cis-trans isomerase